MLNKFDPSISITRKVEQFTMKGIYIKTFLSIKDGVKCDGSRDCSSASASCKNYKWSHSDIRITDKNKINLTPFHQN